MSVEDEFAAVSRVTARDRLLIDAIQGGRVRDAAGQLDVLLELAALLGERRIPYALIGGIAVGIRSHHPRATEDIDVAASVDRETITHVLEDAGFVVTGEFPHSVNFRHRSGEPVQVAFDSAFDGAIERAEVVRVRDVLVRIVTLEDLIEMKERSARDPARRKSKSLRDQADVELLRGDVPSPDEGW